jgi:hypothetical protein
MERPRDADLGFPQLFFRLVSSIRNHRRRRWHSWHPADGHCDPTRGWRAMGLGGPARTRGLLRGELHACLELPAGAFQPFSGAGAHTPRDRAYLQSASHWRADLSPAPAARFRLRHHWSLRRRPFRRDHQGISRVEEFRRRRLAQALLAEHQAGDRIRLVDRQSRPVGP